MPDQPEPKRRWFQYSLRTLLLLTAALGIWLAVVTNGARQQKQALAQIHGLEIRILYDYQLGPDLSEDPFALPPYPAWLRKTIGDDYFQTVVGVKAPSLWPATRKFPNPISGADLVAIGRLTKLRVLDLNGTSVTDAGLEHLRPLNALENLCLFDTQVSDAGLSSVAELKSLKVLDLNSTQITDAGLLHLRNLPNLESLGLSGTKITDRGLENLGPLLLRLKVLSASMTQVTDKSLLQLKQMAKARQLNLIGTRMSWNADEKLRAALPGADVHCVPAVR